MKTIVIRTFKQRRHWRVADVYPLFGFATIAAYLAIALWK